MPNVLNTQQALLHAIFRQTPSPISPELELSEDNQGLAIYRNNLRATAAQALTITFPTVEALMGEELMGLAAEKLLATAPPHQGDWAQWGSELANILEDVSALDDYPFIPDCARLDYLCHQLVREADHALEADSLGLLESEDPDNIRVELAPSLHLMRSEFPIAGIRSAHKLAGDERAQRLAEVVRDSEEDGYYLACFRNGFEVAVTPLSNTEYQWLQLLKDHSLGAALGKIDLEAFSFEPWLISSIPNNLIYRFSASS